jgi:hypothetical protein
MDCPAITVSNWLMLRPLRDRLVRPQAGVSSKSGASLGAAVMLTNPKVKKVAFLGCQAI